MVRLLKQLLSGEKGQALVIVLGLLAIGGLTVAVSLNYATTCLKGSQMRGEGIEGVYAAGAGVEHTLWYLGEYGSKPEDGALPENINQMAVDIQTAVGDTYTLYLGEFIEPGQHSDYLSVDGEIVWDEVEEAYKYTITVTWLPESGYPIIHLEEVGVRIPVGYSYQLDSAGSFGDNLSTANPTQTQDGHGAYLLNWELDTPHPSVSEEEPVKTQTFYITGTGEQEGHYSWVVASRQDIGAVGEITGTRYIITATATWPESGKTTARIAADVMIGSGITNILSWQISN